MLVKTVSPRLLLPANKGIPSPHGMQVKISLACRDVAQKVFPIVLLTLYLGTSGGVVAVARFAVCPTTLFPVLDGAVRGDRCDVHCAYLSRKPSKPSFLCHFGTGKVATTCNPRRLRLCADSVFRCAYLALLDAAWVRRQWGG